MIETVDLASGGWGPIIMVTGFFLAAMVSGFIPYLLKRTSTLQKDYDSLRHDFVSLKQENEKQELRHRADRDRDYLLITKLQNKLVTLQLYIATLRGMLAERGIVSPDPPKDEDD